MNSPPHPPNTRTRQPNFDRLARPYRWMERLSFGPFLSLTRTTFLSHIADAGRALILGDGDGRFTAKFLLANQGVLVDAVDISRAMLQSLINAAGRNASRVTIHHADALAWQIHTSHEPWDLIVTHFFLDCLTEPQIEALAARLRAAVTTEARWVISEFAIPHGLLGALVARPLVASLYWAFWLLTGLKVQTLPDYAPALRSAGFRLEEKVTRLGGILVAEMWRLDSSHGPQAG